NLPRLSQEQRRALPYGAYLCWTGEVVLFDRRYRPIFRREPTGLVNRDSPARWVHGIRGKCWFYSDVCSPRINRETLHRILAVQRRWETAAAGVSIGLDQLLPAEWIINSKMRSAA